jgi:hypothetical protein
VIESGVETALGGSYYPTASNTFMVRVVSGTVQYLVNTTVVRSTPLIANHTLRTQVFHGAASMYGFKMRVNAVAVAGLNCGANRLPLLVYRRKAAVLSLPALTISAGWKPYAYNSLRPLVMHAGSAPSAWAEMRLPALAGAGRRDLMSLRALTMTGGNRSQAALRMRAAIGLASDYAISGATLTMPAPLTALGLRGRPYPLGAMVALPRIRGVATGFTSSTGSAALRLPALRNRSAYYASTAMSFRPLQGFAYDEPNDEAFISGAGFSRDDTASALVLSITITSSTAMASTSTAAKVVDATANSVVAAASTESTALILNAIMNSVLIGRAYEPLSEQGAQTWVVGAGEKATPTTMYENYAFNSFATIDGRLYGVKADGLYLLEGDTDAGASIHASMSFGASTFGTDMLKRLEAAYIGVSSTGTMYLKVLLNGGESYTYAARRSDDYMAVQRVDVGRGIRASYMAFELYNSNGADFELNTVSFHAAKLTRRI